MQKRSPVLLLLLLLGIALLLPPPTARGFEERRDDHDSFGRSKVNDLRQSVRIEDDNKTSLERIVLWFNPSDTHLRCYGQVLDGLMINDSAACSDLVPDQATLIGLRLAFCDAQRSKSHTLGDENTVKKWCVTIRACVDDKAVTQVALYHASLIGNIMCTSLVNNRTSRRILQDLEAHFKIVLRAADQALEGIEAKAEAIIHRILTGVHEGLGRVNASLEDLGVHINVSLEDLGAKVNASLDDLGALNTSMGAFRAEMNASLEALGALGILVNHVERISAYVDPDGWFAWFERTRSSAARLATRLWFVAYAAKIAIVSLLLYVVWSLMRYMARSLARLYTDTPTHQQNPKQRKKMP